MTDKNKRKGNGKEVSICVRSEIGLRETADAVPLPELGNSTAVER
jgi:hypothetical protein